MTIIELINNWSPMAPGSRTFLLPYSCKDELCDFIWGNMAKAVFCDFLESNSDLCINNDYTTIRPNHFLNDKYNNLRVESYTFYANDLFIVYKESQEE